ncbi:hypothetical protein SCG7086_AR_00050 [Chlamydiales bacterium SCGC AG-110-P3]|nr:hypothetical protein SCG7086_AR_00050 [Chlamydiales bacterium SCGC AG-110-P3]
MRVGRDSDKNGKNKDLSNYARIPADPLLAHFRQKAGRNRRKMTVTYISFLKYNKSTSIKIDQPDNLWIETVIK